ncbi:MAG: Gfo/Idh/MocA family oxidoreductase [Victivallales bacterium]|nr:Gfo/Idh/MocA family oxidoreductase [Victivallales bacterium]
MRVLKVGIVGFGRSGFGIHAKALSGMKDKFDVVAVTDFDEARRSHESFPNAKAYDSATELIADPNVELVVVATYNYTHASVAIQALNAGKHVMCEKPFGLTTADVDAMIAASHKAGVVLQPFQQRRYEPAFEKLQEVIASGVLGRLTHVKITWNNFNRRWDWQTSRERGGGQLYNNCPHLIDYGMCLLGKTDPEVWCDCRNSLGFGDAEDEVKIILRAPEAPLVDLELLSTCAYHPAEGTYVVCGTSGTLHGSSSKLEWDYVDWSQMPQRALDMKPLDGRVYCREEIQWQHAEWLAEQKVDGGAGKTPSSYPARIMYNKLYDTIVNGAPQEIPPEVTRTRIAVLQKCASLCGHPFPLYTRY